MKKTESKSAKKIEKERKIKKSAKEKFFSLKFQ